MEIENRKGEMERIRGKEQRRKEGKENRGGIFWSGMDYRGEHVKVKGWWKRGVRM